MMPDVRSASPPPDAPLVTNPPSARKSARHEGKLIALFCLLQLAIYLESKVITPFDSGWTVPIAYSLIEEGNTDLDEYRDVIPPDDYRVIVVDGHLRNFYPVAPAVLAVPPLVVFKYFARKVYGIFLDRQMRERGFGWVERTIGAMVVVFATFLLYRLARRELGIGMAMLLAFTFAFSTSAWSVLSRALWQHSPLIVCMLIALLLLMKKERRSRDYFWAAVALAVGYWMRPTGSEPILVLSAWVLLCERRHLFTWAAGLAAGLAPFLLHNYSTLGTLLPSYYVPGQHDGFALADFGEALAGTLISPGRGLFIYCPIVLLAFLGFYLAWRAKSGSLYVALAILPFFHWFLLGTRTIWWGGYSYGPRLFADVFPIFFVFLIPVMKEIAGATLLPKGWPRPVLIAAFSLFLAAGIWINEKGTHWPAWDWNGHPRTVDEDPSRNWDWDDTPWSRKTTHYPHAK